MSDINLDIGDKPDLAWVDVGLIDVDSNYQREIRPALVDRILRGFSWAKFGALVLTRKDDGRYNVVEGQHRWKAAELHPDISDVPAVIEPHAGMADEAGNFLAINRDRMAVTSVEQYWAGLTAGDPTALAVSAVLQSAGCDVVPSQGYYRPHLTNSISAVKRCIQRYGDAPTKRALLTIRAAWPDDAHALRGVLITALARIIRNNAGLNDADLAAALRPQSLVKLTAHAEAFRKLSGGSSETAITKAVVEIYNKGKRVNTIQIGEAR
jgi:hypothetical protein